MILNRNRIPPLPRGMLASRYDHIPPDARRVIARLGARDVVGVGLAMKKHHAESIDELVGMLDHYEAQRNVRARFERAVGRVIGGTPYHPHEQAIRRDAREQAQRGAHKEIEQRVKVMRKRFKEINR